MSKQDDFWNNSLETDDDPDKNVAVEVYNHIIIVFSPFSNISDRLIERAFEMSVTDYPYGEFSKDNNIESYINKKDWGKFDKKMK